MKNTILPLFALLLFCNNGMAQVSASTPPRHGTWVKIKVQQTGKYLSVANGSKENGARIVQWDDVNQKNQKFQVQKNEDGSYSFFAAHSGKSICADKGDNREGDLIIQNSLSQYFGKWQLQWMNNCGQGFKMLYKSSSGRPLQVTGVNAGDGCQLIEPQYHDGDTDCPYVYLFELVDAPLVLKEESIKTQVKTNGTIKKGNN